MKCPNCEFVYVNPRPLTEELADYYPQDCPNFKSSKITFLDKLVKNVSRTLVGNRVHSVQIGKLLDVGFGQGDYLLQKEKEGYNCFGVDISQFATDNLAKLRKSLHLECTTLAGAKFADSFFDVIHLSHVLEHDPNPLSMIKEVFRIMKKGGRMEIEVPNFGGLYYKIAGRTAEYFIPQHLGFFTPKTLESLIKLAGFSDYTVSTSFGNNMSYYILNKLGLQKSFYNKSVLNQLLGIFVMIPEKLLNLGDVIKVTAYK